MENNELIKKDSEIIASDNPEAPHQAIIAFRVDVYERDNLGRCIGPPNRIVAETTTVVGKDFEEIVNKVNDIKEEYLTCQTKIRKM